MGDERSPPGEQAIWALERVWRAHTYGPKPPAFARDLVLYLSDPVFHDLRNRLVTEMSIDWCDEAEAPIARLFGDDRESPQLRYCAAYVLMNHARDKDLEVLLDFAEEHPGRDEEFFIANLMSAGSPRYGVRPADSRLLRVAHDIMERDIRDTGRLSDGSLMANSMGAFIATRDGADPFAADQNAPGNRLPDGNLSEKFFETPVIRARAWWDHTVRRSASLRPSRSNDSHEC